MSKAYNPKPEDIAWARMTVGVLRDGGHWGCSWGLYRVDKASKTITLIEKMPHFPHGDFLENHRKTVAVFGKIGYEVKCCIKEACE